MNKELLDWIDKHQIFTPEHIEITLFVSAAIHMLNGVADGALSNDDLLFWVQGAQHSNSYGEAEEIYEAMKQFEKIITTDTQ